jgi:FKBP-type peptidyl-prolyl cis-trans isomerase
MKMVSNFSIRISGIVIFSFIMASCSHSPSGSNGDTPVLKNRIDTLSWAYGQEMGRTLSQKVLDTLNMDIVFQAAKSVMAGNPQPITDQESHDAMQYLTMLYSAQQIRDNNTAQRNIDKMQEMYFENLEKTNPKVKKHPSGFYYEVVKEGNGPKARYAQRIEFDYRSFLMFSGEPYDQTYERRPPILHVVGTPMFQGLIDGFQLMNAGSIYRFYFPYQLAFGAEGSGDIPGYTPFIYEVELHKLFEN